jgi:dihydropyrimidinase
VIFDSTVRRTLSAADLHGSDYSAWDGWEVHGWPETVLLRGKVVIDLGKLLGGVGTGPNVPRKLAVEMQNGPAV